MFLTVPKPIPLTQEAYDEFKDEFARLSLEREEILKRLQLAREQGDLSENGAYKCAKMELGDVGRKLRHLTIMIRFGKVMAQPTDIHTVQFGHTITLVGSGKTMTFTLVGKHESDPMQSKLSTQSPIGQAVVGRKLGETIHVQTPQGAKEYVIRNIE